MDKNKRVKMWYPLFHFKGLIWNCENVIAEQLYFRSRFDNCFLILDWNMEDTCNLTANLLAVNTCIQ